MGRVPQLRHARPLRRRLPALPPNAVPAIHESGAVILCDCMDGAVGQAIDYLDNLY